MRAGAATRRIVLAGHSTGANKVLYYAAKTADRRVTGLILLGPISDIAGEAKRIGRRELGAPRGAGISGLAARRPPSARAGAWGFWSARRYISLYRPGEAEDVFPLRPPRALAGPRSGRSARRWRCMVGGRDEFLDRSPEALRASAFAAPGVGRAELFTGRDHPGRASRISGARGRGRAGGRRVDPRPAPAGRLVPRGRWYAAIRADERADEAQHRRGGRPRASGRRGPKPTAWAPIEVPADRY